MAKKVLTVPSNLKSKISKPQSLRVLIVEDSEDDALLIIRELKKGGYNPVYERVETAAAMKKALEEKQWDAILCDYTLPKFSVPKAITLLKETNINIPFVLVSGSIGEETAVECMRLGAQDYIMKDSLSRLCPAIKRELEEAEVRSKHKQAEFQREAALEALRVSEEKHRTILENIEDGYYEVDLNGNFIFFNASICRILGYPQEEMMGMNNRQFTDKENAKKLFKTFNEVYRTGEPAKEFDWQIIRKDGTKRYIEVSVSLQKNSSGKPIGFRGIARDITERKRVEETLQESEKYFKEITENSSDIIIITDKNGDIKYCGRSIERFTGYKPEELIGRSALTLIHPDDKKRAAGDFGKAILAIDSAIPNAFRIVHKDGSERYFEGLGKNLLDNPAVAGFIMNVRDITARKQMEDALRQSEKRYRTIIDTIQDGYIETDITGKLTFINDMIPKHLGYSREELIGKNSNVFQDEVNYKKTIQLFTEVYKTGKSVNAIELECIRKDGTKGIYELSLSIVKDAQEKPIGFRSISRDITERKQAEKTLHESEEKYRTIIENMQENYYENDLAGNYTFVNDTFCKSIGYSQEELIGMNYRQIEKNETTAKKTYQAFNEVYRTGEPLKVLESEYIRKDGTIATYEQSASLIRDVHGKPIGFRSISRDITERKRMEEEIRQSEEKYRNILENMQEGYFELDLAGNFIFVNEAECRNMGYPREELIGMNNRQYQDETTAQKTYQLFMGLYRTGETVKASDIEITKRNGTKGFNEISVSLIRDSQGKPIGFRGISRDITERKQAEAALLESNERYKALFDRSLDLVYVIDFEGRFIDANDAALNRLGYTREEIHTLNFVSLLSEDQLPLAIKIIQEIQETGIQRDLAEFRLRHKNGSDVYVETQGSTIVSNGTPVAIQAIARNISERKKAEEESRQSVERMRKALRATVQSICMTVEMKDPYTAGHQQRVSDLARSIAKEMGLSAGRQDFIRTAASIHDIGKIAIPTEILSKPTKLTDLEFNLIKTHSQSGYDILKDIEFPWPVADVVLQHHERMDGSGYPQGLKGDDIIMEARILAVADVVEAIASHRPYRPALGIDLSLEELSRNKGILYDADAVNVCLRLFREKGYNLVLRK